MGGDTPVTGHRSRCFHWGRVGHPDHCWSRLWGLPGGPVGRRGSAGWDTEGNRLGNRWLVSRRTV